MVKKKKIAKSKENSLRKLKHKRKSPTASKTAKLFEKYGLVIACILASLVYFQTISYDLTNLDDLIIKANHEYLGNFSNISEVFLGGYLGTGYYRPVVTSSLMIDAAIGGTNPSYYHFSNLIFHLIAVIGIFFLLNEMKFSRSKSILGAMLYAVHPLITNSVTWIFGRNDLLVGMFTFYTICFFLRYLHKEKILFFILHILALFLALLSKEIALLIPILCLTYYLIVEKRRFFTKESIISAIFWIIAAGLWYLLRSRSTQGPSSDEFGFNLFLKNLPVVPEMFSKFFLPFNLSVLPSYGAFKTISGLLLMAGIAAYFFLIKSTNKRFLLFSVIWLVLFILPSMFVRHSVADEYFDFLDCRLYVPLFGLLMLVLVLIPQKFVEMKQVTNISVIAIIIVVLSVLTIMQNRKYSDPFEFWHKAAEENPDKPMIWNVLGENYRLIDDYQNAEKYFYVAARLNPRSEKYLQNLSHAVTKLPDPLTKVQFFDDIARKDSSFYLAYYYASMIYVKERMPDKALDYALKSIKANPGFLNGKRMLCNLYTELNKFDEAFVPAKEIAASGDSSYLLKYYLSKSGAYFKAGNFNEAIDLVNKALAIDPNNIQARKNLAVAYLSQKNFAMAEQILKETAAIYPNDIEIHFYLMRLYLYDMQRYDLARTEAETIRKQGGTLSPQEANLLGK